MRFYFSFLCLLFFQVSFCQNNKAFIYKSGVDALQKDSFLTQEIIQTDNDSLKIVSFYAYFSTCPHLEYHDPVTMGGVDGNSLKGRGFVNALNERHLPVCITFDNITCINQKTGLKSILPAYTIKVY